MTELQLRLHMEGVPERTLGVTQNPFIIGRTQECDLCLPFSEVSRQHTQIIRTETNDWMLEDLGSTNGTVLNQFRLHTPQVLNHQDVIQIGNVLLGVILRPTSQSGSKSDEGQGEKGTTILRKAEELRAQWIKADQYGSDTLVGHQTAISRLKYLVEIAKGLNSAQSIEAIFNQVKEVVFQEIDSIDRLALLVDINHSGKLRLLKAAGKSLPANHPQLKEVDWISNTICHQVFTNKVSIKSINAQTDHRFQGNHSILAKGIQGALAAPIWDRNRLVGVLYGNANLGLRSTDPLEDEELSFFSTLANLVASSVQRWLLNYKLQREGKIRQKLERYLSPAVVQQMIAVGALEKGRIAPTEADVSILFADLVNFTAMSENMTPKEIAQLLNRLFEEMLHPVFDAGGTLDKFIGDCIMAFFGAPEPQEDHGDRAVKAALAMLSRLQELNTQNVWSQPLQLRIAINSGKAVVGDVGSSQRVDYTVLGATVNLASRMEAICPPGECVISEDTYHLLTYPQNFVKMGKGRFKGIARPITVYQSKLKPEKTDHSSPRVSVSGIWRTGKGEKKSSVNAEQ